MGFISTEDEVDHLFTICNESDVQTVIEKIIKLVQVKEISRTTSTKGEL